MVGGYRYGFQISDRGRYDPDMAVPLRSQLEAVFRKVVADLDPYTAVERSLTSHGLIAEYSPDQIHVIGIGKASVRMAEAAVSVTEARSALVATPYGPSTQPAEPLRVMEGAHPIPGRSSVIAGTELAHVVEGIGSDELLIAVVSGGGSACVEIPSDGVSIDDLGELNRGLIDSGLDIGLINEVRAGVSNTKAGKLVAGCRGTVLTLVVSDVVGSDATVVASGPTVPSELGARAGEILDCLPADVVSDAVRQAVAEWRPAPGRTDPEPVVVADSTTCAESAAMHLSALGFRAHIVTDTLAGEARDMAPLLFGSTPAGTVGIATGETTVTVTGGGIGGRNHEAAASVLQLIGGHAVFGAFGTDGVDGRTGAAGAVVDGSVRRAGLARGRDVEVALLNNDTGTFLADIGAAVVSGPTGTNVGDLWMWARGEED